ncbi:hypothetical protein ACOME3_009370 [Neoechinorhynchus agilis]
MSSGKSEVLIDVGSSGDHGVTEVGSSADVKRVQRQVHEVVDQMRANVSSVLDREESLKNLKTRSEALNVGSAEFSSRSRSVNRRAKWKSMKLNIIIGAVIVLLILLIALVISARKKNI